MPPSAGSAATATAPPPSPTSPATARVGGTVAYAYFADKEALFLAAVDEDAAAVIAEGVSHVLAGELAADWHRTLMITLVDAIDRHPLARRLLAGLEPDITVRVLEIPALAELRKACTERLRAEQLAGTVRTDIDAATIANGVVAMTLSLLMSVVQLGPQAARVRHRRGRGVRRRASSPADSSGVNTRRIDPPRRNPCDGAWSASEVARSMAQCRAARLDERQCHGSSVRGSSATDSADLGAHLGDCRDDGDECGKHRDEDRVWALPFGIIEVAPK